MGDMIPDRGGVVRLCGWVAVRCAITARCAPACTRRQSECRELPTLRQPLEKKISRTLAHTTSINTSTLGGRQRHSKEAGMFKQVCPALQGLDRHSSTSFQSVSQAKLGRPKTSNGCTVPSQALVSGWGWYPARHDRQAALPAAVQPSSEQSGSHTAGSGVHA